MKPIYALTAAALLLAGSPAPASAHASGDPAAMKKMARGFVEDVFNKHSAAAADKYIAQNCIEHAAMPGQKPGIAGFKDMANGMFKAFPDLKVKVLDVIVDGDKVAILNVMTGTSKGAYMGMPPTGKTFSVTWIDWMTLKDGKFFEHWGYGDTEAMMAALAPPKGKGHK